MENNNQKPEDIERILRDYQNVQQQLRTAMLQTEQLNARKIELSTAADEVKKATGKVYFTIGGITVETTKDKAAADISEKTETVDIRLHSLEKQINELKLKEKQLRDEINKLSGAK